ncbi:hypothetical protein vseg_013871 [Gypsophila vaccaria]
MSYVHAPENTSHGGVDAGDGGGEGGEFMLFGVRVVVDAMRKSVSLNNLSQYEHRIDAVNVAGNVAAGYTSADDAARRSSPAGTTTGVNRERKRGVSWTEEEHKRFLVGLEKLGKGDWRGISRNFVKTRTPTQVASHAQKYFIRHSNLSRRRRRSSVFDITTSHSSVANSTNDPKSEEMDIEAESQHHHPPQPLAVAEMSTIPSNSSAPIYNASVSQAVATQSSCNQTMANFDVNTNTNTILPIDDPLPLSLNLSLSLSTNTTSLRESPYQIMQGFSNSNDRISVA